MTKSELSATHTLGAFNPVDYAVLACADDSATDKARQALLQAGFADADVLTYTSRELFPDVEEMMRNASGAAGFGYEIVLMRRYMTLASEGCGWLAVYCPEDAQTGQVQEVARRLGVKSAVRYGRLASEDLI
ncbi:MAG: hypothetical protein M3Z16_03750 [Pseudomonadota bacterium]|nr:hypothetical protein [Pseudomonadota bacterium]